MDDTSVLEPLTVKVSILGEALTVTPLKIGQIPRFLRVVRPLFGALAEAANSPGQASKRAEQLIKGAKKAPKPEAAGVNIDILELITEHGDTLIHAVAIATNKEVAWLENAEADEFGNLVKAILEVNADFFAKRMALLLGA